MSVVYLFGPSARNSFLDFKAVVEVRPGLWKRYYTRQIAREDAKSLGLPGFWRVKK